MKRYFNNKKEQKLWRGVSKELIESYKKNLNVSRDYALAWTVKALISIAGEAILFWDDPILGRGPLYVRLWDPSTRVAKDVVLNGPDFIWLIRSLSGTCGVNPRKLFDVFTKVLNASKWSDGGIPRVAMPSTREAMVIVASELAKNKH